MRRGRLVLFGVLSLGCALPSLAQESGSLPEKKLAGLARAVQEEQAIISESVHAAVMRMIGQLEAENEENEQTTSRTWWNSEALTKTFYNSDGTKSIKVTTRTYKAEVYQEQYEYGAPEVIEVGRSNRVGYAFEAVVRVKVGARCRSVEKTIEIPDRKIPPGYRDWYPSESGGQVMGMAEEEEVLAEIGSGRWGFAGPGLGGRLPPFSRSENRPNAPSPVTKALATAAGELDRKPFTASQTAYRVSLRFSHKDAQWEPFSSSRDTRHPSWPR